MPRAKKDGAARRAAYAKKRERDASGHFIPDPSAKRPRGRKKARRDPHYGGTDFPRGGLTTEERESLSDLVDPTVPAAVPPPPPETRGLLTDQIGAVGLKYVVWALREVVRELGDRTGGARNLDAVHFHINAAFRAVPEGT